MDKGSEQPLPQEEETQPPVKEITLSNGEIVRIPIFYVDKMTLYRGTPIDSQNQLEQSSQDTIGSGVYLTPDKETAIKYGADRASGKNHSVYETEISDMQLADIRGLDGYLGFIKLFKQILIDWEKNGGVQKIKHKGNLTGLIQEVTRTRLKDSLEGIDRYLQIQSANNSVGKTNVQKHTFGWGFVMSQELSKYGFKGVIGTEGEPPKIDFHESVVIFNPSDVKIIKEEKNPQT